MPLLSVLLTKHTLYVTQSQDPVFWENFSLNLSERIILLHSFQASSQNTGMRRSRGWWGNRRRAPTGDWKRPISKTKRGPFPDLRCVSEYRS